MIPVSVFLVVLIIFTSCSYFFGLDEKYIGGKTPNYKNLNKNVIDFLQGKNDTLSNEFNAREKTHLADVKKIFTMFKIVFFMSTAILIISLVLLKNKIHGYFFKSLSKILVFGGAAALIISFIILIFLSFNFESTFETFHTIFFRHGTYLFDPTTEMLTRMYSQQLFNDLGFRISISIVGSSLILMISGFFIKGKVLNKM